MALFIAAKFSQEEMPVIFDPGAFQDLKPQEFVVVPRGDSEDVAFVASLEHKSIQLLKLRRDAYPRVLRRATPEEVQAWWDRKVAERRAMVLCKDKARELNLDIKVSHVRIDMKENRAIFHFTSEQRIDFRALVRDVSAQLKLRVDLWQIGVRDEARMVDGFGICGLQTCCSSWLKEFRPITIRMAKEQDINLPPTKLSGQCGRLLCCLSYEVDQYKEMAKSALPKGATITYGEGKQGVIIDRNLVASTYLVSDQAGGMTTVKASEIGGDIRVPDQMKRMGKEMAVVAEAAEGTNSDVAVTGQASADESPTPRERPSGKPNRQRERPQPPARPAQSERPPQAERPQRDAGPRPPKEAKPEGRPESRGERRPPRMTPPPAPAAAAPSEGENPGAAPEERPQGSETEAQAASRRRKKGRKPQLFRPSAEGMPIIQEPIPPAPSRDASEEGPSDGTPGEGGEGKPTGRRRKKGRR